jgi:hypothetical protein
MGLVRFLEPLAKAYTEGARPSLSKIFNGASSPNITPGLNVPAILDGKRKFEKEKPWNRTCANSKLSQQRGVTLGFTPPGCALFCAHPTSKTVALDSNWTVE